MSAQIVAAHPTRDSDEFDAALLLAVAAHEHILLCVRIVDGIHARPAGEHIVPKKTLECLRPDCTALVERRSQRRGQIRRATQGDLAIEFLDGCMSVDSQHDLRASRLQRV